jgi:acetylornithine/succinyldiaminopimelate/putrescine aminotransferase
MTVVPVDVTTAPAGQNRLPLLSLDDSLALDIATANKLYSEHLNKYLLQVYEILGLGDMDIVSAQGIEIHLKDGRTLLDFSAGIGILGLGHNHPRIIAAERKCHDALIIDCIKVAPHKLQGALAYNIAQYLPDPLNVSFFATSGAEAVEAALKICERVQLPKGKTKFISMDGGFHGKTHGVLSMTTTGGFQRGVLLGLLKENVICVPYGDIAAVEAAIRAETFGRGNRIIGIIVEPVRGAACELPPPGFLTDIARLCRENDILSIFDEVKVGMGRTGRFCAFQREDVVPDVVTLAKTLGGGKRAIGAMVTSQALFDQAYGNKADCALHTSSFSGLGESCAVAIETLNVMQDEKLIENAAAMGAYLNNGLNGLKAKYPKTVLEVSGMGMFQAIRLNFGQDLVSSLIDVSKVPLFDTYQAVVIGGLVRELYERHNILVHFQVGHRDILHFVPPLIIERKHIDALIAALDDIFSRGISSTTLQFVVKNMKRVFSHG